jgi:hypothetical protein
MHAAEHARDASHRLSLAHGQLASVAGVLPCKVGDDLIDRQHASLAAVAGYRWHLRVRYRILRDHFLASKRLEDEIQQAWALRPITNGVVSLPR